MLPTNNLSQRGSPQKKKHRISESPAPADFCVKRYSEKPVMIAAFRRRPDLRAMLRSRSETVMPHARGPDQVGVNSERS